MTTEAVGVRANTRTLCVFSTDDHGGHVQRIRKRATVQRHDKRHGWRRFECATLKVFCSTFHILECVRLRSFLACVYVCQYFRAMPCVLSASNGTSRMTTHKHTERRTDAACACHVCRSTSSVPTYKVTRHDPNGAACPECVRVQVP